MDEERLGAGIGKFRPGDTVALASKAACSKIHLNSSVGSQEPASAYLEKVGTVDRVTPMGQVKVTLGRALRCTIDAGDLVKMRNLLPGDLVQLVDDIRGDGNLQLKNGDRYKSATEVCGRICLVLENSLTTDGVIYVTVGAGHHEFRPFHLDFVATPLYGDYMARVTQYACAKDVSPTLVENLFAALQNSMQDLPDIDMFASNKSSPYGPGNIVKVSDDVRKFIEWQLKDSPGETRDPLTTKFQTLQDYARSRLQDNSKSPFPTEQVVSLLEHGKVVQVNPDGDVIVEFGDGRAWCIRSSFLQLVESSEACGEGTRTCYPKKLYDEVDKFIRHAHSRVTMTKEALLHAACFSGNENLIQLMLDANLGVDCEDENGNKPLHYAAHGNQPEIVKFLLRKRANINATNKRQQTALHYAVKQGFLNCVRQLTEHHLALDANIQDDIGNTALHLAVAKMNDGMVEELATLPEVDFALRNKDGLNTLHMAASKGNVVAADKILSKRKELVNEKEEYQGYAALHFAAVSGHHALVETLLNEESCTVDLLDKHEETALLLAAREGHWGIVESLLLAGANINKADPHGNTALHFSLIKMKDPSAKPLDMPSSLAMKAVEKKILHDDHTGVEGRLLVACFLARCGADTCYRNKEGKTPLDLASDLEGPAANLLGYFSTEKWDPKSGKCKLCLEVLAKASFTPCGHSLYCHDCARRMKRCLSCKKFILGTRPAPPPEGPSSPANPNTEKIEVIQAGPPIGVGEQVYKMEKNPRGMCIIINNINFEDPSEVREGSDVDAEKMKSLFEDLHFDVTKRTDLSAGEMLLLLTRAANSNRQKNADCLVVILMSHGDKDIIYGVDGTVLHLRNEVYPLFNNARCPALQGKPKLFFIQACRGGRQNYATNTATDSFAADSGSPQSLAQLSDMYCAYATIPDHEAIRNTTSGSWFMSAVFSVFREHAATTDLEGLMRLVTTEVMRHCTPERRMQTTNPDLFGWRYKLYFNPGYWV